MTSPSPTAAPARDAALPGGVVHDLPEDLHVALRADESVLSAWLDITPLARNEFICWVTDAKRADTRARRIAIALDKLGAGERRPCCWPGCQHRERTGR